ncbi:MAG: hypothetical protein J5857_04290 [Treponema sp.]|nr:hypothetical protein [Treponema sp.]
MKKTQIFKRIFLILSLSLSFCAFSQSSRPVVSNLETSTVSTNKIELRWTLPANPSGKTITGIAVYRDTKPIKSIENMLPLAVTHPRSETWQDTVTDLKDYYYAVVCVVLESEKSGYENNLYYDEQYDRKPSEIIGKAYTLILPGVNATVAGIRAKGRSSADTIIEQQKTEKIYRDNELRERPLPYMDFLAGETYPDPVIDKNARNEALSFVTADKKKSPVMENYIFQDDVVRSKGEDAALFDILKGSFINRRYTQAEKELYDFTLTSVNQDTRDRACFYLGECYYYNGKLSDAVRIFISLQDKYPSLSRKWTDACLDIFEITTVQNNFITPAPVVNY